jgi:hypothetical protein
VGFVVKPSRRSGPDAPGPEINRVEPLHSLAMCHGYTPRDWSSEVAEEFEEELEEETDDPSFVEEEPAEDVELLTDGGDGTPQSADADEDE